MPKGYIEVFDTPQFRPGFRFSILDSVILVVGSLFAYVYASAFSSIGLRIESPIPSEAVAVATLLPLVAFFLFCNVFRVCRPLELAWAGLYVGLLASTTRLGAPDWRVAISVSGLAMIAVIVTQMQKPSYHGVGWQVINPKLPAWWKANVASKHTAGSGS